MLDEFWIPKLRELHRKRFKSQIPADILGRVQQTRAFRQHGFTLDQIKVLFENSSNQGRGYVCLRVGVVTEEMIKA